jgi:hypothetical protein
MIYGVEAVLPTDLQYGSPRVQAYQLDAAEEDRGTPSTYSSNLETRSLYGQQDTNRHSSGTTCIGFTPELSKYVIWFYGGYKLRKVSTSCPYLGRDPT